MTSVWPFRWPSHESLLRSYWDQPSSRFRIPAGKIHPSTTAIITMPMIAMDKMVATRKSSDHCFASGRSEAFAFQFSQSCISSHVVSNRPTRTRVFRPVPESPFVELASNARTESTPRCSSSALTSGAIDLIAPAITRPASPVKSIAPNHTPAAAGAGALCGSVSLYARWPMAVSLEYDAILLRE